MSGGPRARRTVLGIVVAAAALGCADVADPSAPFALEFLRLPWPSVVFGDTLRDSSGVAAPLGALVFDARGGRIPDAPVTYVALDTGVRVLSDGRLVPTAWRDTPVRLVATSTGLQSRALSLAITRRPDTLVRASATVPVIRYDIPPTDPTNTSAAVQVRLFSRQAIVGAGTDSTVRGWVVTWRIVSDTPPLADSMWLVGEAGTARTDRDTTDNAGTAGVRLRIFPKTGQTATDSVVLEAAASHRGAPVPGSPVRIAVRLERAAGTTP